MSELTIDESIKDPNLIYIGRARLKPTSLGLWSRLREKTRDHLQNIASPHSGSQLDPASKAAVYAGWSLEVSWATVRDNAEAEAYEAALIRCYKAICGRLPGFMRPDDRRFVRGNKQTPGDRGDVGTLIWSCWKPMVEDILHSFPKQPGVYRLRALPPTSGRQFVAPSLHPRPTRREVKVRRYAKEEIE